MNELQIFNNPEFGQLHAIEIDGKRYVAATEAALTLGYANPRDAISRHCKGVVKHDGVTKTTNQYGTTTEQIVTMNFISEGDLLRLIINSKLPKSQEYEIWVFEEVLPAIHKTGSYALPKLSTNELVLKLAEANVELEKKVDAVIVEQKNMTQRLETTLEILATPSKASWRDEMNYTLKQIFKDPRQRYRLYDELEKEANVTLDDRLNRLRKRMRKQGARHKDMRYVNKLDVISQDRALIPIFEGIVKRYQAEIASQICFSDNEIIIEEVV